VASYSIAPCPKCNTDAWQKLGGYRNIPVTYSCMACGLGSEQAKRIEAALNAAKGDKA